MMETLNLADIDNAVGQAFGRQPKAAPPASPASAQPSQTNFEGLQPTLLARLNEAKDAYKKEFGVDMPITGGVRTRAEQQRLFEQKQGRQTWRVFGT